MKFLISFLLLILFIKCDISKYDLTDWTYDKEISYLNSQSKYLIVFHVLSCVFCQKTIQILENEVIPKYQYDKNINFGFINCDQNFWLTLRYNITQTPYIFLIENKRIYKFNEIPSLETFSKFIEKEKDFEDGENIPDKMNLIEVIKIVGNGILDEITIYIQNFLNEWNLKIQWNKYYTGSLLVILITTLFFLESMVLKVIGSLLCGKKDNKKNQDKNEKENNKKENNENNIEEKNN
jgi:hypothetical protein